MAVIHNRVGELLAQKQSAEKRPITREELREAVQLSETAIRNWVYNRVTRYDSDAIVAWMRYFNVTIDQLLYVVEDANPKLGRGLLTA